MPSVRQAPALAKRWLPKIFARDYDKRFVPIAEKKSVLIGMGMTENQGGSDLRTNVTRAEPSSDGSFRLYGHKWFMSAPMCDAFLPVGCPLVTMPPAEASFHSQGKATFRRADRQTFWASTGKRRSKTKDRSRRDATSRRRQALPRLQEARAPRRSDPETAFEARSSENSSP